MTSTRFLPVALAGLLAAGLAVGVPATPGAAAAGAPTSEPVITSVTPTHGSSVGFAHLVIRGRHLKGGTVTVAGRLTYAHVINSRVISAFPAGHRHGTGYPVIVRTRAGTSNMKRYEYRSAPQPGVLRVAALPAAPGGRVGSLYYSLTRCPAVRTCISVGTDDDKADPLLARITSHGTTVTQRVPVPADYDERYADTAYFVGLSCPTTTFCAAVGGYNDDPGLVSTWNGSRWTTRSAPTPPGNPDAKYLNTVSCGAPSHCVALGDSFVDTVDDGTPASSAAPAPAGYTMPELHRVSCHGASTCTVVGSGGVGKTIRNFVAVRHDSVWTTRVLPDPPKWKYRFSPDLAGLDCTGTDRCTVLAGGLEGAAPLFFATLHAGKVRWHQVPVPADAPSGTSLFGDSEDNFALQCPSAGTCWALTDYRVRGLSGNRDNQPVALRLRSGAVRVFPLPRPATSETGLFDAYDLSCATATACVAVGSRGSTDVNDVHGDAVVETFSDGVWTPADAPSPAGRPRFSGYEFTSVACSGVGRCTALGDYNYAHNPDAEGNQRLEKFRPVELHIVPR